MAGTGWLLDSKVFKPNATSEAVPLTESYRHRIETTKLSRNQFRHHELHDKERHQPHAPRNVYLDDVSIHEIARRRAIDTSRRRNYIVM